MSANCGCTLSENKALTIAAGQTASTGTVTITAVNNDIDAPNKQVIVSGAVTSGSVIAPATVTLIITDDDTRGVTISTTALDVSEGSTATYTVKLNSQPTASVTVTPASNDTSSVTVSGPLNFTTSDWSITKIVTVTAVSDTDFDSETVTVSHSVGGGGYESVSAANVTVTVTDTTTNTAPSFNDGDTAIRSINENTAPNTNVGAVLVVTDPDGDTLNYTLTGADASSFTLESGTRSAQLKTQAALNFETKSSYSVTVNVRDGKNVSGGTDTTTDDTIVVTINVNNVNEAGTVTFNAAAPQVGTELTASLSDLDGSVSGVSWAWLRLASASATSGTSVGTNSASYTPSAGDIGSHLRATASYTDGQGPNKTAAATMANVVQAAPNAAPTINTGTAFDVAENSTSVVTVQASDGDAADSIEGYAIVGGTDEDKFSIGLTSGALTFNTAPNYENRQDADRNNVYNVTVQVTSGVGPRALSATQNIAVTVTDVNEPPVFSTGTSFSVQENSTEVTTVRASDPDSVDSVEYTITGGADQIRFSIGLGTGALAFVNEPNYENPNDAASGTPVNAGSNNEYVVVVTATGGSNARAMTRSRTIVVTVTNVNESGAVTFSSEEPEVGRALTANLGDPDGNLHNVSWQWARGDSQSGPFVDIGQATSASYTPVAADADKWLRATATYNDGHSSGETASGVTSAAVIARINPAVTLVLSRTTIYEDRRNYVGNGDPTRAHISARLNKPIETTTTVTVTVSPSPSSTSQRYSFGQDTKAGYTPGAVTLVIPAGRTESRSSYIASDLPAVSATFNQAQKDALTGSSRQVWIRANGNDYDQPDLTLTVSGALTFAAAPADPVTSPQPVAVTIVDNERTPDPVLVLNGRPSGILSANEGDTVQVTAVMDEKSGGDITLSVSHDAPPGILSLSGTQLTIPAHTTRSSGSITITILQNSDDAPDLLVALSASVTAASGYSVKQPKLSYLRVIDDDPAPGPPARVRLFANPSRISENGGRAEIVAVMERDADADITITVGASPDARTGATSGDYTLSANRTLTIRKGENESSGREVWITAVDNGVDAPEKEVWLNVVATTGQTLTAQVGHLTIIDDDERTRQAQERQTPGSVPDPNGSTQKAITVDKVRKERVPTLHRRKAIYTQRSLQDLEENAWNVGEE